MSLKPYSVTGRLIAGKHDGGPSLQGAFDIATNCVVEFKVSPRPLLYPNPVAEVLWSLAGNTIRRIVSITDGASIGGVAEHVTVNMNDQTQHLFPPFADAIGGYTVSCQCGPGVRPNLSMPPLYFPVIANDNYNLHNVGRAVLDPTTLPNNSVTIPIPQNAGISSILINASDFIPGDGITPLTDADIWVRQIEPDLSSMTEYSPLNKGFVPIWPQASAVVINNFSATLSLLVSFVFGIDG